MGYMLIYSQNGGYHVTLNKMPLAFLVDSLSTFDDH